MSHSKSLLNKICVNGNILLPQHILEVENTSIKVPDKNVSVNIATEKMHEILITQTCVSAFLDVTLILEQGGSVMCVRTLSFDPAHLHFSLNCLPNEAEIKKLKYQHIVQQITNKTIYSRGPMRPVATII